VSSTNRISFTSSIIEASPSDKADSIKKPDTETIKEECVKEEHQVKEEEHAIKEQENSDKGILHHVKGSDDNTLKVEDKVNEEKVQNESESNIPEEIIETKTKKSKKRHNK
jgi:hypothetical protein